MGKKIIMTAPQFNSLLMEEIGNTVELKYPVDCDKVLIVKGFLDGHFHKDFIDSYNADGIVEKQPVIFVINTAGENVEQIDNDTLFDRAFHAHRNMYLDKNRLTRFIRKVVDKWLEDKISNEGLLDTNFV